MVFEIKFGEIGLMVVGQDISVVVVFLEDKFVELEGKIIEVVFVVLVEVMVVIDILKGDFEVLRGDVEVFGSGGVGVVVDLLLLEDCIVSLEQLVIDQLLVDLMLIDICFVKLESEVSLMMIEVGKFFGFVMGFEGDVVVLKFEIFGLDIRL